MRPTYALINLTNLKKSFLNIRKKVKPAKLMGVESNGMLLAASDEEGIAVISPDRPVKLGSKVK